MEDRQILDLVATDIGQEYLQEMGVKAQEKTPIHVLDNDYNAFHSSKLLLLGYKLNFYNQYINSHIIDIIGLHSHMMTLILP